MKRRVIHQGNSTLTMTLPRRWCDALNVHAGDELDVVETAGALTVRKDPLPSHREIEIEMPRSSKGRRRFVLGPYVAGYDVIRITFHDADALGRIQDAASLLIGFEITEQGTRHCVLTNIAKGMDEGFDTMFLRLQNIAIDMTCSVASCIDKKDATGLSTTMKMEVLANRLNLFCRRMVNKLSVPAHESSRKYRIVCLLEEVTDHLSDICDMALAEKMKVDPRITSLLTRMAQQLQMVRSIITKKNMALYDSLCELDIRTDKELRQLAKVLPVSNVMLLMPLNGIKECVHDIAEELI